MKIKKIIIRHTKGGMTNQNDEFNFSKTNTISLGRSNENSVQFDPEFDKGVSRTHAEIIKGERDGQFFIKDMASLNGVLVNNQKIGEKTEIFPGDQIQLGLNGPCFTFDLDPRPAAEKATELMQVYAATEERAVSDETVALSQTPQKDSIGKETFERAIVVERKKSTINTAAIIAGCLLIFGALGFAFKDNMFPPKEIEKETIVVNESMDAAAIAKNNTNKLVQIESAWKLTHAMAGDDIYHEYTMVEDPKTKKKQKVAIYIQNNQGGIEPLLGLKKNVELGEPITFSGRGSGFVVDKKGHIMTNKHVSSSWMIVPYSFPRDAQEGILLKPQDGKYVNAGMIKAPRQWIPGETKLFGRKPYAGDAIVGVNTYLNVIFAKTSQRIKASITKISPVHDLALLKIDLVGDVDPVTLANKNHEVNVGDNIISLGFPGLSPDFVKRTKDQSSGRASFKTVPNPTLTDGRISKIIESTKDASIEEENDILRWGQGHTYQMTINTGGGNSGGPVFNSDGEVIGVLVSGRWDYQGSKLTYSIPIEYARDLMTTQTVIN